MTTRRKRKLRDAGRANRESKEPKNIRRFAPKVRGETSALDVPAPQIAEQLLDLQTPALQLQVLKDQQVKLDHRKAEHYINLPEFDGEREIHDTHVDYLVGQMRSKLFNPTSVVLASAIAQFDGRQYKINGQHTSWAVKHMPDDYFVMVREVVYDVENPEQLKLLYASFDRNLVRSNAHITKTLLIDTPAGEGMPRALCNKLTGAVRFWQFETSDERRRCTPQQLAMLLNGPLLSLWQLVLPFVAENCTYPWMIRQPVVAAIFATFNKVPTLAPNFWVPVLSGLDLGSTTDPRWKLRDYLQQAVISAEAKAGQTVCVSSETLYRGCLLYWNAWRTSTPVRARLRPQVLTARPGIK